jgi:Asp-tRNA(Asn)/Glu-tRNA(Gln) amidotransferase A subunit family amidase
MNLGQTLRNLGGRMGVIRVIAMEDGSCNRGPRKVTTRTVTLKDLATEVRHDSVRLLAEKPAELEVPFAKVFEAAGVKAPPRGWTVARLDTLLRTDEFKGMERAAVQKAVLGMLSAEQAKVEDIVKDAVAQDQALDAYDAFVRRKMEDRAAARQRRIDEIRSQIKELEQEAERQNEESRADRERWRAWLARKIAHEQDMVQALSVLLDVPVVSITPPDSGQ